MFRFILPFIFLLIPLTAIHGQNSCNCPERKELDEKFKTFQKDNQLSEARQYRKTYAPGKSNYCKIHAAVLLLNMEFRNHDSAAMRNIFAETESLIDMQCYSYITSNYIREKAKYYFFIGKTDTALTISLAGLKYAQDGKLKTQEAGFLSIISQAMFDIGEIEKSVYYQRECARLCTEADQTNAAIAFGNLAAMYGSVFDNTKDEIYLDSIIYSLNESNIYLRKINNNKEQFVFNYSNLADVYTIRKDYKRAKLYCDSALASPYASPETKMTTFSILQRIYENTGDPKRGLQYADSSYQCALLEGRKEELVLVMYSLYESLKLNGDTGRALTIFEKLVNIRDSLNKSERITAIREIEEKFNKSKNEETIRTLEDEKKISTLNIRLLSAGIISALLVILLIVIFFRQKNLKNKQNLLETEQRLNRARMNPHFFFNTLSALQTSALKEKDPVKLADLLATYSKIMRITLESTYTDLVTIEEEISYLELYLKLQQFRTNGNFAFTIEIPDEIPVSEVKIPGMLIQPFIENSIEHGFAGIAGEGKITISFAQQNETIQIKISDNGTGIKKSNARRDHKSRATEITRDRLFLLSSKYNSKARFEMHDNPNGTGTTVDITLPLIY